MAEGQVDHMSRAYRLCFLIMLVGHKSQNTALERHATAVSRKQTCNVEMSWHKEQATKQLCDNRSLLGAKLNDVAVPSNQAKQTEPGSDAPVSLQLLHPSRSSAVPLHMHLALAHSHMRHKATRNVHG